jgi:hypothetical protein
MNSWRLWRRRCLECVKGFRVVLLIMLIALILICVIWSSWDELFPTKTRPSISKSKEISNVENKNKHSKSEVDSW